MNEELLDLLVCPLCHGALVPQRQTGGAVVGLDCQPCGLRFPVEEGIPVMLQEEALPLSEVDGKGKSGSAGES